MVDSTNAVLAEFTKLQGPLTAKNAREWVYNWKSGVERLKKAGEEARIPAMGTLVDSVLRAQIADFWTKPVLQVTSENILDYLEVFIKNQGKAGDTTWRNIAESMSVMQINATQTKGELEQAIRYAHSDFLKRAMESSLSKSLVLDVDDFDYGKPQAGATAKAAMIAFKSIVIKRADVGMHAVVVSHEQSKPKDWHKDYSGWFNTVLKLMMNFHETRAMVRTINLPLSVLFPGAKMTKLKGGAGGGGGEESKKQETDGVSKRQEKKRKRNERFLQRQAQNSETAGAKATDAQVSGDAKKGEGSGDQGGGSASGQKGSDRKCFGCGKTGHDMTACKSITPEQKRAIWKTKNPGNRSMTASDEELSESTVAVNTEGDRGAVTIRGRQEPGMVEVPALTKVPFIWDGGNDFAACTTPELAKLCVEKLGAKIEACEPVKVKTANGLVETNQVVKGMYLEFEMPHATVTTRQMAEKYNNAYVLEGLDQLCLGRPLQEHFGLKAIGEQFLERFNVKRVEEVLEAERGRALSEKEQEPYGLSAARVMSFHSASPSLPEDDLFPVVSDSEIPRVGAIGSHQVTNEVVDKYESVIDFIQQPDAGQPPSMEELRSRLGSVVDTAVEEQGFPARLREPMMKALLKHPDVWRNKLLCTDPPARVEPMKVQWVDHKPFTRPPIRQVGARAAATREFVNKMIDNGLGYSNPQSPYANPAFAVAKPGKPGEYRIVCDLRGINQYVVKTDFALGNVEDYTEAMRGCEWFFEGDMVDCFWQQPLSEDSQEPHTYITPEAKITPTRVPQGQKNSAAFVQGTMTNIFRKEIAKTVGVYIDNVFGWGVTGEDIIETAELVMDKMHEHGMKFGIKSFKLSRDLKVLGRIYNKFGTRHDPARIQGLLDLGRPVNAANLMEFLCALQWFHKFIPKFAPLVGPLQTLLNKALGLAKAKPHQQKRSKVVAATVDLEGLWGAEHEQAFLAIKQELAHNTVRAHPDPDKVALVFPDASDLYWGCMISQVSPDQLSRPVEEMDMEPLAFCSGAFVKHELARATVDKEGDAIHRGMNQNEYALVSAKKVVIYCDHRNLAYLFSHDPAHPGMTKPMRERLQRTAVSLQRFDYTIEHIPGERQTWGDILSRWRDKCTAAVVPQVLALRKFGPMQVFDTMCDDFMWPTVLEIAAIQSEALLRLPDQSKEVGEYGRVLYLSPAGDDRLIRASTVAGDPTTFKRVWIPHEAEDLRVRMTVISHQGSMGHRGVSNTLSALQEKFLWMGQEKDVKGFIHDCLHCLSNGVGERIPRPLLEQWHATKPQQMIVFDYVKIGDGIMWMDAPSGYQEIQVKYVLCIVDDFSSLTMYEPCYEATARGCARALLRWFAQHGIVQRWLSDRGAHFLNEVMDELRQLLRCHHHFVVAHNPYSRALAERGVQTLQKIMQALMSELRQPPETWPQLLPVMESIENSTAKSSRSNMSPIELHSGNKPVGPLSTVLVHAADQAKGVELVPLTKPQIDRLATELHQLKEEKRQVAAKHLTALRDQKRDSINEQLLKSRRGAEHRRDLERMRQLNSETLFQEGVYVTVATVGPTSKIIGKWEGPCRVVKALEKHVYTVEELVGKKRVFDAHISRLRYYCDADVGLTTEVLQQISYTTRDFVVDKFLGVVQHADDTWHVLVKWKGFEVLENSEEPVEVMMADIPRQFNQYLDGHPDKHKVSAVRAYLKEIADKQSAQRAQSATRKRRGSRGSGSKKRGKT